MTPRRNFVLVMNAPDLNPPGSPEPAVHGDHARQLQLFPQVALAG